MAEKDWLDVCFINYSIPKCSVFFCCMKIKKFANKKYIAYFEHKTKNKWQISKFFKGIASDFFPITQFLREKTTSAYDIIRIKMHILDKIVNAVLFNIVRVFGKIPFPKNSNSLFGMSRLREILLAQYKIEVKSFVLITFQKRI